MKFDEAIAQAIILDHSKYPHNYGRILHPSASLAKKNAQCADAYAINIQVQDGAIKAVSFEGEGCALSKASFSLFTDFIKEKSVREVLFYIKHFEAFILGKENTLGDQFGDIGALGGVKRFPRRFSCVLLVCDLLKELCSRF